KEKGVMTFLLLCWTGFARAREPMNVLDGLNCGQNIYHRLSFWGLLTLAIILRLAAFQGYSYSDPRAYAELAFDLSHGVIHIPAYAGPPVFPIRLGIYAPMAALIKIFGLSGAVLGAYSLVVSMAGCLLIYRLTAHMFSPLAGLIALGAL